MSGQLDESDGRARTDLSNLDDRELVRRLGQCQFDAMAELYERHSYRVRVLATDVWGDDVADQIVLDVFGQLWQTPESYDAARGSVGVHLSMQVRLWDPPAQASARDARPRCRAADQPRLPRSGLGELQRHIADRAPFGRSDRGESITWDRRR